MPVKQIISHATTLVRITGLVKVHMPFYFRLLNKEVGGSYVGGCTLSINIKHKN